MRVCSHLQKVCIVEALAYDGLGSEGWFLAYPLDFVRTLGINYL